ncbi:MAG: hypothetical protein R3234_04405 [Thermoanaerobaculia bacterium]|nr:hypothetical protein [Thermoanaerobaculia bacterium]
MQTIFALFTNYDAARAAVDRLLGVNFSESELNVIVDTALAETALEISRKTSAEESEELQGLDGLLAREEPVGLPATEVYATGTLATSVVETAAGSDDRVPDLETSLAQIGLSEEMAATYASGLEGGGLLFWIRVEDDRVPEVEASLRALAALGVQSLGG